MIITIKQTATDLEIELLTKTIEKHSLKVSNLNSENLTLLEVQGDSSLIDIKLIESFDCVSNVQIISVPYKKASRQYHQEDTVIEVGDIKIGGNNPIVIMAGPCSIESEEQLLDIATTIKNDGAKILRAGAYKPRTSPYSFQGLRSDGIEILNNVKTALKLPVISEIMSIDKIPEFVENVDIIQVGARNMQNFELLKALGKIDKPILLKRGLANTIEEWLMSAEYILAGGNSKVILCERGIRTFETSTRNTLDLSVIPVIKKLSHLPIIVDPSHATGRWDLVESMSLAAICAGADGLLIEVHNDPNNALSDGSQALKFENFKTLMNKAKKIAKAIDKKI